MRANGVPYNMAKAALEALALTMAKEEIGNGDPRQRRGAGPRRDRQGAQARQGQARRVRHQRSSTPRSRSAAYAPARRTSRAW